MASKDQRKHAPSVPPKAGPNGRRTLRDMMDVLDDTLTGVLGDTVDTKKANTIVGVTGKWMSALNIAIRATKAALPENIRDAAALPPAQVT